MDGITVAELIEQLKKLPQDMVVMQEGGVWPRVEWGGAGAKSSSLTLVGYSGLLWMVLPTTTAAGYEQDTLRHLRIK